MKKRFLSIEISETTQRALKARAASQGVTIRALITPALDQLVAPITAAPQSTAALPAPTVETASS